MSITDELREWKGHIQTRLAPEAVLTLRAELNAIADRIDAEHECAMSEQLYTIDMCPVTDETMAEHGWIRLPKDADGEYINIGDVMAYADNTKPKEVIALVPPAVFLTEDGPRYADMCHHYHAPTVEDVLREMLDAWGELPSNMTNEAIVAEYAKRLQLREVDE